MTDEVPTIDNVLPEFKKWVCPPDDSHAKQGAIVAVPGLFDCPWCDTSCDEVDQTYLAICRNDPRHVVQWCPWGG